jgi:hypothetical protein
LGDSSQFTDPNIKKYAEKYKEMCKEINNKEGEGTANLQLGRLYAKEVRV